MSVHAVNAKALAGQSPMQNGLVLHQKDGEGFLCGVPGEAVMVDLRFIRWGPHTRFCQRCQTTFARLEADYQAPLRPPLDPLGETLER